MASAERALWAQALLGRVLRDKWRLDRLIAYTESGAVYAGLHRNGRLAAIKVLIPELSRDDGVRARFLREGYVANRLRHPAAVAVLDDDVADDGSAYLVMELLTGETLHARWLRQGMRVDIGDLLHVADSLLDVLAAAHDVGIIHRDVKPQNVMMLESGGVKLLDFGLALLPRQAQTGWATPGLMNAEDSSATMGTPAFMPPEQALARWDLVDGRTDIWAVGATLFTMISGRHVHDAPDVASLLMAAATRPARSLTVTAPSARAEVVELVDRALAFEREARWPDARAMMRAVRDTSAALFKPSTPGFMPLPVWQQPPSLPLGPSPQTTPESDFSFSTLGPVVVFALIVGTIVLGMYFAMFR